MMKTLTKTLILISGKSIILLVINIALLSLNITCNSQIVPKTSFPTDTKTVLEIPTPSQIKNPGTPSDQYGPLFQDVTTDKGLNFLHNEDLTELQPVGAGVLVFDFDGNGLDDIYITDSLGPNALYKNSEQGVFREVAAIAGIDDPTGHSNGACAADFDNDGNQDLYVTNHGSSKLFKNKGDGTFIDITDISNVGDPDISYKSTGCAWGDYDQDGYLDLVVSRHMNNLSTKTLIEGEFYKEVRNLVLYHNENGSGFKDVTDLLGHVVPPKRGGRYGENFGNLWGAGFQPSWFDFDNDGDLDLYVANDWGTFTNPNVLWRNDGLGEHGDWAFADISEESRTNVAIEAMSISIGDYNIDGHMDIFVTNVGSSVLLKNSGDGLTFNNVATQAKTEVAMIGVEKRVTWGSAFFDYDNDGMEDLYIVSGFLKPTVNPDAAPSYMKYQHNKLLQNNGDGTFTDVSINSGADDPGVGRGLAYLDLNNDGCIDLIVANLGNHPKLFENTCKSGNNWIIITLTGNQSNRDGIGARIKIVTNEMIQIREISGGGSFMSQHMKATHFGIGKHKTIDELIILWPSGIVQTLTNIPANQRLRVSETPNLN